MSLRQHFKLFLSWLGSVLLLGYGSSGSAAELNLSNQPLFLGTQILSLIHI